MAKQSLVWAVAITGILIGQIVAAERTEEGDTPATRRDALKSGKKYQTDARAFFGEIDKTYPFFDLKRIRKDWRLKKKELRARVRECESDSQFLGIVLDAIKCLRDSHMQIRNATAEIPWPARDFYPGISFMPGRENAVVVMRSPPEHAEQLPAGTVIQTINGEDAREYLDTRAKRAWESGGYPSPQRARLFEYRIPFRSEQGATHTIGLLREGESQKITLTCSVEAGGWPHTYNLPSDLVRVGRSFHYTKLPSGVGYMYVRRVDQSVTEGIRRAKESHPAAVGWIVDLRGNGGGGYGRDLKEQISSLPRPVTALIDAGCISAGETLARDLRRSANARLFGSKTAGSSSAKRNWQFPSGIASVTIPVRSRWRGDRKPIEYNGIDPDELIEASPGEVSKGLNTQILAAEKYILQPASKSNNARKGSKSRSR